MTKMDLDTDRCDDFYRYACSGAAEDVPEKSQPDTALEIEDSYIAFDQVTHRKHSRVIRAVSLCFAS